MKPKKCPFCDTISWNTSSVPYIFFNSVYADLLSYTI